MNVAAKLEAALETWPLDREQRAFVQHAIAGVDEPRAGVLVEMLRDTEAAIADCLLELQNEMQSRRKAEIQIRARRKISEQSHPDPEKLLPPRKRRDDLLKDIQGHAPLGELVRRIDDILAEYEDYAAATGDESFLIRSATNLGNTLIESSPRRELSRRGEVAVRLARKALACSTSDPFVWGLWSDGLIAQGRPEWAERVGWYAIHRFPEDPLRWTKLATLLAGFPDRTKDAEKLLREARSRFPRNDVVATQFADLLVSYRDDKSMAEAQRLLAEVVTRSPDDTLARDKLRQIGRPMKDRKSKSTKRALLSSAPSSGGQDIDAAMALVLDAGRMRQLAFDLPGQKQSPEWRAAAFAEIDHFLRYEENVEFAQYLKNELAEDGDVRAGGDASFAVAFANAMKRKDADRFQELEQRYSGQAEVFDVARAFLFENRPAASHTLEWLRTPPASERRTIVALHRMLLQQFGSTRDGKAYALQIKDPDDFLARIAANDNVRQALIDAVFVPAAEPLAEAA